MDNAKRIRSRHHALRLLAVALPRDQEKFTGKGLVLDSLAAN